MAAKCVESDQQSYLYRTLSCAHVAEPLLRVALQQADAAVQQAAGRIMQAKQIAPDLPQIDLAVVESLKSGIYLDIISGALSECAIVNNSCSLHPQPRPHSE